MNKPVVQNTRLKSTDHCLGFVGPPKGKVIPGWLVSVSEKIVPILFVNGRPAKLINWPLPRGDVNKALGLPGDFGFEFSAEGLNIGDLIELYVFDGQRTQFVHHRISTHRVGSECFFQQVLEAKRISEEPNSVAITCWDGAHNPLGRAYTLYQALKLQRPVVLISFLFAEFGGKIWPPLEDTPIEKLMIPWENRHDVFEMMQSVGLSFPTVWICKPRFPNFELAANVVNQNSKLVLDHDDNEHHFAMQTAADRAYGPKSVSLAAHLQTQITAHTAASRSLALDQNAELVRHVRQKVASSAVSGSETDVIKIGFIGTVRPHKGVIEAARAIRISSWTVKRQIEFHVYGIFEPSSLMQNLTALGAVVKDNIPNDDLPTLLSEFEIVLAGFPSNTETHQLITKYQISSKIGDALAAGLPVLVPAGESVADLEDVPGVFLFTYETFTETLQAALDYNAEIELPDSFTLDGAYTSFQAAEKIASYPSLELDLLKSTMPSSVEGETPTLLIIWKQNDAGLYGRRVDQVARSYKDRYPDHRVIVLEFCHASTLGSLTSQAFEFSHDAKLAVPLIAEKSKRACADRFGVEYHSVTFQTDAAFREIFVDYLRTEALFPQNTKLVLFPVIGPMDQAYDILSLYRCLVDIVDNQFAWANDTSRMTFGRQYSSLLKLAKRVVFNSVENRKFFEESGLLGQSQDAVPSRPDVIPNWYFGGSQHIEKRSHPENTVLIYSGNMNDRVDWRLLESISDIGPDVTLHLVGLARRSIDKLAGLTDRENVVYWGPLPEDKVARLMSISDAGIVPHLQDHVSTFMNPLKVYMYKAHGLPVIATNVPGIGLDDVITCKDRNAFLDAVQRVIRNKKSGNMAHSTGETVQTGHTTDQDDEISLELADQQDVADPKERYLDLLASLDV